MKTRFKVLLSSSAIIPLLAFSGVWAHEEAVQSTSNPDEKLTVQERLEKRKTELNIKQVTNVEKLRIQQKCKASQGNISSIKGRITGIDTSRANVYKALTERLDKLDDRFKTGGIDTTQLHAAIDALNTKIEVFKTDLTSYKLAVSDLAEMECAADPAAFKASLEAARAARVKVAADTADIKKYVHDTIKPTLQQLKAQLQDNATNGGNQ